MTIQQIVIEDKTTKAAIQKALKQLNAKECEVDIKVLREERKGLFGMEGAETAKIQATLKKSRKKRDL